MYVYFVWVVVKDNYNILWMFFYLDLCWELGIVIIMILNLN